MIIALAGRRIDAADEKNIRFPPENVAFVRKQLMQLFESIGATALVCSAACGADLIGLEVAGAKDIERQIILPFKKDAFRAASVTDRPGDWGTLFDKVYQELSLKNTVTELNFTPEDDNAYEQTNLVILEKAAALADALKEKNAGDQPPHVNAVIVWEGSAKDKGDTTEHFRQEAEKRDFSIHIIHTLKG